MSNVTLAIGGRTFTVACADGEEAHVARLGQLIDAKVTASGAAGQTESRMLLFAALLLADEVHDLQSRPGGAAAVSPDLAERLARVAGRIENLAEVLETASASA